MADLLPESWSLRRLQEEEQVGQCCHSKGPVTNLLLWLEGNSILVAILSSEFRRLLQS